jgi:biotin carboxyl carrier protein
MRFVVRIADRDLHVEIDGAEVCVEGKRFTAALQQVPGTPLYQLISGRRSGTYALVRRPGGWVVQHGGDVWVTEVSDERTAALRALKGAGSGSEAPGLVRAPMPGLVLRVEVEEGQRVVAGAGLVVLEAMKMENEIRSTGPGTVGAVLVEAGQAVEKGAALVEITDEG